MPIGVSDPRIRAVLAFAPLATALDPRSLAAITRPVWLEVADRDDVLAPKHHGQWLCDTMPSAHCQHSAQAGHFAAFQPGTGALLAPGAAGLEPSADPPGFDRRAWQAAALLRVKAFLAQALSP